MQTVCDSVAGTLSDICEKQISTGQFDLAEGLIADPRLPEEKSAMLMDAHRRARLQAELEAVKADPDAARERLDSLRQNKSSSMLAFTEDDFAALENQIAASANRKEAERIQHIDRISGSFAKEFALGIKTGDFTRILAGEEELLSLDTPDIAEKSKLMRDMYTSVSPLLDAAKGMPFHDREAAHETAFAKLAATHGGEAAHETAFAKLAATHGGEAAEELRAMCRDALEEEKAKALKDPAAYAAALLQQNNGDTGQGAIAPRVAEQGELGSPQRFAKESAAIQNMAAQEALFKGVEGFEARVLTAQEAAKAKAVLADEKTANIDKINSFVKLHEAYASLGDTVLGELEFAPQIRAAIDLAIKTPGQAPFAAALLGAGLDPESAPEAAQKRLAILAGTNEQANEALAYLMAENGKLDVSGAYQVAGPAVAPGNEAAKNTPNGQSFTEELLDRAGEIGLGIVEAPGSVLHGGIKAANATADLIYDGMDWLQEKGWFWTDDPIRRLQIPNLPDPRSKAGKMVSGISQFLVGFKGYDKALQGIKAASLGTNITKSAVTGFLADFTVFDGQEERFSNLIQKYPALANPFTEFLAAKPGDGKAEGRLKNALEGLGLGMVAESVFYGLRTLKAGRELTRSEMKEAADALSAQKQERAAAKKETGSDPGMDYTDTRSPDTMHHAGKELRETPVAEADRLYVGKGNNKGFYSERNAQYVAQETERHSGAKVTPVEVAPGQWKIRVDSVPPIKTEKELKPIIDDFYEKSRHGITETHRLGVVGPEEAARIKAETGHDVLLHKHEISSKDIKHAMERHNQQAAAIGELPLQKADISRYPEIITKPDKISRGDKPGSIIYEKRFSDGTYYITEQIIQKGNKLEFKTMYKNTVAETMRPSLVSILPTKTKGRNVNEPAGR